jgi:hypothetical protein
MRNFTRVFGIMVFLIASAAAEASGSKKCSGTAHYTDGGGKIRIYTFSGVYHPVDHACPGKGASCEDENAGSSGGYRYTCQSNADKFQVYNRNVVAVPGKFPVIPRIGPRFPGTRAPAFSEPTMNFKPAPLNRNLPKH